MKKTTWKASIFISFIVLTVLAFWVIVQKNNKPDTASAPPIGKSTQPGSIVISKGGTYSGNWESTDSEIPAVEIRTFEKVIIENATIKGAGYLIKCWGYDADVTVRQTRGYGLPPTPWKEYEKPRRFLIVNDFKNVVVENCYMENTAGIYVGDSYKGNGTEEQTVKIRFNKVKNIDGRIHGGWYRVQFVQFNFRNALPHAEISWNEITNEPDRSRVEDNINIYNTRGLPSSPIQIHNNYIEGAYPLPATSKEYSGGGIITDSPDADSTSSTAFVHIHDNQLVALSNYCIGIAGGNNISVYNNRAIVSAMFDDGTAYSSWTSGIWAKDYYKRKATFKNKFYKNILAVAGQKRTWRNEIADSTSAVAQVYDNNILQSEVTKDLERKEFELWQDKVNSQHITLGPETLAAPN
ncbi:glycosyl hydrolase [Pontibacter sp. SGAir0037]|uniref:glycosyl hydrolase n=1 Tax=Pontibacter sp. SGAir0037 TaxID=2571030 RepID=UPI001F0FF68C|nr:glycosyl hydrolase [Pontibacter sp. SGAir0037]